jgi:hypothetical protein
MWKKGHCRCLKNLFLQLVTIFYLQIQISLLVFTVRVLRQFLDCFPVVVKLKGTIKLFEYYQNAGAEIIFHVNILLLFFVI